MEITVTAKTYDEAITEALLELQTTSEHLDVEVLEKGSEGLFGVIGGKPWVIRAREISDEEIAEREKRTAEAEAAKEEPAAEEVRETEEIIEEEPAKAEEIICSAVDTEEAAAGEEPEDTEKSGKEISPIKEEKVEELKGKAVDFLENLFRVMNMDVNIGTSFDHTENEMDIILSGDDMGVLIGKRGQTLDSLQYLTSLVVNKHFDSYIRVKLDTENYRERRQVKLEELAHNIAKKVTRTKKPVDLEPMNPYERRIIHSALQNDPYVTTISEGEDPYRHVVVILKKPPRKRRYN